MRLVVIIHTKQMRANVSDIFLTQLFVNLDGLMFIIWKSKLYLIERGSKVYSFPKVIKPI